MIQNYLRRFSRHCFEKQSSLFLHPFLSQRIGPPHNSNRFAQRGRFLEAIENASKKPVFIIFETFRDCENKGKKSFFGKAALELPIYFENEGS